MKQIGNLFTPIERPAPLIIRTTKEDLIAQIVAKTDGKNAKTLAKLIALWANRYQLDTTDLHALLKKADDPSVRNYSAFVNWSIKDNTKEYAP